MELIGDNIILRKAKESDLASIYHNVYSDETLFEFMFFEPTNSFSEGCLRLKRSIEFQKNTNSYFIALKDTDEAIGFCGVREIEPGIFCETGICIASKYQNLGYGKEALSLLLSLVFSYLQGSKFIYECACDNVKSKKLCQKFGFKYIYTKEEVRNRDGLEFKIEHYELTIDSYLLNRNK